MIGTTCGFDARDIQRFLSAMKRVAVVAETEVTEKLPMRGAVGFQQEVMKNLQSNTFATAQWEYNPRYRDWKADRAPGVGYLRLGGDLLQAVKVFPYGRKWMAGIPASARDPGGKSYGAGRPMPIAWYARIQEYGGTFRDSKGRVQRHKPRAVWRPTRRQYRENLWPKEVARSRNTIGKAWR